MGKERYTERPTDRPEPNLRNPAVSKFRMLLSRFVSCLSFRLTLGSLRSPRVADGRRRTEGRRTEVS